MAGFAGLGFVLGLSGFLSIVGIRMMVRRPARSPARTLRRADERPACCYSLTRAGLASAQSSRILLCVWLAWVILLLAQLIAVLLLSYWIYALGALKCAVNFRTSRTQRPSA